MRASVQRGLKQTNNYKAKFTCRLDMQGLCYLSKKPTETIRRGRGKTRQFKIGLGLNFQNLENCGSGIHNRVWLYATLLSRISFSVTLENLPSIILCVNPCFTTSRLLASNIVELNI